MRNTAPDSDLLHVAVGVIANAKGEVLIARRPDRAHQGGLWEFPGGKLEAGETVEQALRRELKEELNIEVMGASPLIQIRHAYPDRRVLLDVRRVESFSGEAQGLENQPIAWVAPEKLADYPFPPANKPIISAARLPDHYAIVEDESGDEARLKANLHRILARGVKFIQLRAKGLSSEHYREMARYALKACAAEQAQVLLNAEPALVCEMGASGVHLTAKRLMALQERPLAADFWVAASCHDLAQLKQAERLNVDFAVLAPVLPTKTHPDSAPLGWRAFQRLAAQVNLPVFALGGLAIEDLPIARAHGAQGIAGIRLFIR